MTGFVPKGMITGIGSLPHTDANDAVQFVAQYSPQVPFWPQLPQRSPHEGMIAQMLSPLLDLLTTQSPARFDVDNSHMVEFCRRLRTANVAFSSMSASGFYAFQDACQAGAFPQAVALKGQLTGPITLANCLFSEGNSLAIMPDVYEELTDYLIRLGLWQLDILQQFGLPVLIFVDEPALMMGQAEPDILASLARLIRSLRDAGAYTGIHCCATDPPIEMCAAHPDIVSFDACVGLETFLSYPQVQTFIESGGAVAFGLIPNIAQLTSTQGTISSEAFVRWVSVAERFGIQRLSLQSMFTATCGLGLLDVKTARDSFAEAQRLSELVHKTMSES